MDRRRCWGIYYRKSSSYYLLCCFNSTISIIIVSRLSSECNFLYRSSFYEWESRQVELQYAFAPCCCQCSCARVYRLSLHKCKFIRIVQCWYCNNVHIHVVSVCGSLCLLPSATIVLIIRDICCGE